MTIKTISIATWNVNSVRARLDMLTKWLESDKPDILLLQETKCVDDAFPAMDMQFSGYNYVIKGQKSYNGVAILSKYPINMEIDELPLFGTKHHDHEARYIEGAIEINGHIIRVANGNSVRPSGTRLEESERFIYKLRFFDRLIQHMQNVSGYQGEIAVFGGDYNVAHQAIDLHNPLDAEGDVGFHIDERKKLDEIIALGYKDCFRELNTDSVEYSWWDHRTNAFARDKGWRIDYLFANNNAMRVMEKCKIEKAMRGLPRTSDHVPVVMTIVI
jgi:exodeoxyribonuclease-3